jgi:hypothetical protein
MIPVCFPLVRFVGLGRTLASSGLQTTQGYTAKTDWNSLKRPGLMPITHAWCGIARVIALSQLHHMP